MNEPDQPDLAKQVHRLDFAAAVRREQEQAIRQLRVKTTQPWQLVLVWMAIGAILLGGGMFVVAKLAPMIGL